MKPATIKSIVFMGILLYFTYKAKKLYIIETIVGQSEEEHTRLDYHRIFFSLANHS